MSNNTAPGIRTFCIDYGKCFLLYYPYQNAPYIKLKSFFFNLSRIHLTQTTTETKQPVLKMSVRSNNQFARNKYSSEKTVKKFCGVCHKAGLSERDYTSHYTKSTPGPQGIVICPTILNNECSFCFQLGHFKSACPAIAAKEKHFKKIAYEERRSTTTAATTNTVKKSSAINRYDALRDDSDEEIAPVCGKRKNTTADATIVGPKPVDVKPMDTTKPSFAAMLAREAPKPVVVEEPIETHFTVMRTNSFAVATPLTVSIRNNSSWVDMSDDEEW